MVSQIDVRRQGDPSGAATAVPTDASAIAGDGRSIDPGEAVVDSSVTIVVEG